MATAELQDPQVSLFLGRTKKERDEGGLQHSMHQQAYMILCAIGGEYFHCAFVFVASAATNVRREGS